jgi:predicted nuclease of restriction endonuclease-like (RecB) superfamily
MKDKSLINPEELLFEKIVDLIESGRKNVIHQVNEIMTLTYFEIGKYIVEYEQQGKLRAEYAKATLQKLSNKLNEKFGKGFGVDVLNNMRKVYSVFKNSDTLYRNSGTPLSWSHYLLLSRITNEDERNFYQIEATQSNWSFRELKRQFESSLFERLVLSRDKEAVKKLSQEGQIINGAKDLMKEPLILEFLGVAEQPSFSESDLETAIIDKIEKFMLELGKGFLFEARQKRFTFDEDHFFIDLVLYNRLLRCYVLIDLKIGKLKHQDLGQMQMYVNYYDRHVKTEDENLTIGIILCKDKNDALVEITLPLANEQIFATKYQMYLPSKEEFRKQLKNL